METRELRIDGIIAKFKNGQERFKTDPLVHQSVMAIYHGQDPIEIIDQLIKSNNEILDKLTEILSK
jgi:uncharacterized protein YwgA